LCAEANEIEGVINRNLKLKEVQPDAEVDDLEVQFKEGLEGENPPIREIQDRGHDLNNEQGKQRSEIQPTQTQGQDEVDVRKRKKRSASTRRKTCPLQLLIFSCNGQVANKLQVVVVF